MRLSKLTKAWFDFPDDPDGARFEIKHLLSGDLAAIEDKANQEVVELVSDDAGNQSVKAQIKLKKKVRNELTTLAAVTDWENIDDADQAPLKCTNANKLRFCRELPKEDWDTFLAFLDDCRVQLAEQAAKQEEQARGN